ncbi:MAG: calcium-binding protein [Patulibacter minatonensis]
MTTAVAAVLIAPAVASAGVKIGTPGADRLKAAPGGSMLWGGGGADTLIGGPGNDRIYGVRSDNKISGNGGNDYIEGGAGSDVIDGGSGNNTIFGSSGQDKIVAGDGNNYVDVGGGHDSAILGDGDNVLLTASGGGTFEVGDGNNTVYYGSGISYITAGKGVNTFYLSGTAGLRKLDCGGNPASTVYVNEAALGEYSMQIFVRDKARHCPNITTYDGNKRITAKIAGLWNAFDLSGGPGRDKLFGGHGGGTIDGGEGDNEIWADHNEDTGLPRSQGYTTKVNVGDGNNRVFGGRGTNIITAGNGNNLIRAGAWINDITAGSGDNIIRLQGAKSTNTVVITGRGAGSGSYVESLANGKKPVIKCINGAQAAVVYGNTKPHTNCRPLVPVRSKKGAELQLERTPGVPGADEIVENQLQPGDNGIGVPRPNGGA